MAEPGGAVEVHGAITAVDGAVAKEDPDLLLAQIERTRDDLARTIDALAERVSPANNLRKLREKAAEQFADPQVRLGAAAVGLAIAGIVVLRIWARRRR